MPDDTTVETPIENMSLPALFAMQTIAAEQLTGAKFRVAAVAGELSRRLGESVKKSLADAAKTHGTTSLPLQDNLVAKGDIKQTVTWDSDALQAVAQTLPWERVAAIFNIKFSVSETIYKGIAAVAPELREKIDAARTTKLSEPVVTLTKAG